jgi:DNA-binding transcriptional ArsR family regulator
MAYRLAIAALADPTRRTVFERIVEAPRSVQELAADLPVSRPAVSQHLKVLKEAGLVHETRKGTRRVYAADAKALGELRAYVEDMWRTALDRFEQSTEEKGDSDAEK